MNCIGEFAGKMLIDGRLEADTVSVFLADSSLSLRKGGSPMFSRKSLSLLPFSQHMLLSQDARQIADGHAFYEISGTRIGGFIEGPLGHPGDGEFDHRPIRSMRLDVSYFEDRIVATIAGKTDVGTSGFDSQVALEPWTFLAEFVIPRAEFAAFFGLNDLARDHVDGLFDKHGRRG